VTLGVCVILPLTEAVGDSDADSDAVDDVDWDGVDDGVSPVVQLCDGLEDAERVPELDSVGDWLDVDGPDGVSVPVSEGDALELVVCDPDPLRVAAWDGDCVPLAVKDWDRVDDSEPEGVSERLCDDERDCVCELLGPQESFRPSRRMLP